MSAPISPVPPDSSRRDSALDYLSLLLIHWRLVAGCALAAASTALAVTFVVPKEDRQVDLPSCQ
ncbi:MAG: hypothetical protein IPK12_13455 [Gemmatimonadetes bacterium]|nr:hypothetical protein [Gemmatimonadota bacterium]